MKLIKPVAIASLLLGRDTQPGKNINELRLSNLQQKQSKLYRMKNLVKGDIKKTVDNKTDQLAAQIDRLSMVLKKTYR